MHAQGPKNPTKAPFVGFDFFNDTKAKMPLSLQRTFSRMKDSVLGKKYSLSVAIVNQTKIRELNKRWREKNEPTDILSFPLSETEGEIYISPEMTKKMAHEFGRKYDNFLLFLFIHGLVHLKGYDHSAIMEDIEIKFRKKFSV